MCGVRHNFISCSIYLHSFIQAVAPAELRCTRHIQALGMHHFQQFSFQDSQDIPDFSLIGILPVCEHSIH